MADQQEFKDFHRLFNTIKSTNREKRKDAVGLLTPALLKRFVKTGKPLTLPYGKKGGSVTFSPDELKEFDKSIEKTKTLHRPNIAGMPLYMLENASAQADKERMRDIRSAVLYKVSGNTLTFSVSSATKGRHQVTVRLEQWHDLLTSSRTWLSGARAASVGNVSFNCTCGRHQYWYRYLATISGCALQPKEQDFPKIRNPGLSGFCCKHTLKAFQQLKSGSVHTLLAKEMEKQANAVGYASPSKGRFLNATELAAMKRARGSAKDLAAALAAYKDFTSARKAFREKLKEPKTKETRKAMEKKLKEAEGQAKLKAAEAAAQKARAQKAERELSDVKARENQLKRDALVGQIGMFVMRSMFQENKTRDQAISEFASRNSLSEKEVDDLAKGAGV